MHLRRAQRGFTLIEMMVVVAIIGILSALVISASSRTVGASARTISEQLVGTLNAAKLRAQATRRVHRIQFDNQHAWVSVCSETGLNPSVGATYAQLQVLTIPAGVQIYDIFPGTAPSPPTGPNGGLNYDLFIRPDSQATASTLFVGDGVHQWRVIVYHITGGTYARETW